MTEAAAFVPGHVTGFFSVHPDSDPTKAGSSGAGIALAEGVEVRVRDGDGLRLSGEPVEMEAVDRVLRALRIDADVEAETDLPVGAGFGVSGAVALGTALAANTAFDRGLSLNELVTIAHGAEVQAGTGLGDVVAQARGGLAVRLEPGAPPHGQLDEVVIPADTRIEYVSFGELSTQAVLSADTSTLDAAGRRALSQLVAEPTVETFMTAARRFAREAELLPDRVRSVIEDVNATGGESAMAMLGETVFSVGDGLSRAGYEPSVTAVHPCGATLQ